MKFYKKIKCEHGWTDVKGFDRCNLGTSCEIHDIAKINPSLQILHIESYCNKDACPIFEKDKPLTQEDYDNFWWW